MAIDIQQPWLARVLETVTFYNNCSISGHPRKTIYCLSCVDGPICDKCSEISHNGHETIRVFKASYGVSIRINDIKRYFDVSAIQPFVINSRPIFFLHSRGKSTLENRPKCIICEGHVKASQYKFCSIACKYRFAVQPIYADRVDPPSNNTIMPSIDQPSNNKIMPSNGSEEGEEVMSTRRKRRKGIPHRSPIK